MEAWGLHLTRETAEVTVEAWGLHLTRETAEVTVEAWGQDLSLLPVQPSSRNSPAKGESLALRPGKLRYPTQLFS